MLLADIGAAKERVSVGDRVQVWVSEVRHKSNKRDRPTLILAMDKNKIYSLWNSGPVANLEDFQNLNDQEWYTGTLTHKLQAGTWRYRESLGFGV